MNNLPPEKISHYKKLLEQEMVRLEGELDGLGKHDSKNPDNWEQNKPEAVDPADQMEIAEKIDEYEDNSAVLQNLEVRHKDVRDAIEKIAKGTYGTCEVSGEKIEVERLEANPAARTCIAHMNLRQ